MSTRLLLALLRQPQRLAAGGARNSRLAYALKQLTTFPMIVGTAVHACARDYALAVRQGRARPSYESMLARVSDAVNRAVLGSHHRGGFLRDPKRVVMLQDAWYSGRNDAAGLAPALTKARLCLRNLERAELWEELEQCRPDWVIALEGPEAFAHEGWPVYAGPDLVYRPDGKRVVILDWKTGDASDAALQIPLYALYCRTVLGIPFREGEWFGRVINLATGADTGQEITKLDLVQAAERVRQSVGAMHALLADVDNGGCYFTDGGCGSSGVMAAAKHLALPALSDLDLFATLNSLLTAANGLSASRPLGLSASRPPASDTLLRSAPLPRRMVPEGALRSR